MLTTVTDPSSAQEELRRTLIRSAGAAVGSAAPLLVTDPRGMIFDQTPAGDWTLRIRGSDRQMVLGLGEGERPWARPDALRWHPLPLEEDTALPGRRLLGDHEALSDLGEMTGPLEQSLSTYRRGRRAVVRIAGPLGPKARYVKLLSSKAFKKAEEAMATAQRLGVDGVLRPWKVDQDRAALVFDEIRDPDLHGLVWSGQEIDWTRLLAGIAHLSQPRHDSLLPHRDMETERKGAVRQLKISLEFLPQLEGLLQELENIDLPSLAQSGIVHGDLHDKQIFLGTHGVRLIDADSLAQGDPRIDLVNLSEHIHLRGLQGCPGAARLAEALWEATALDRSDPAVRALRGLVRARLAGVYARRPWWWRTSLTLAGQASGLLEGLA